MFELLEQFLNTPVNWILFFICGVLIGMAKTGLSGAGLMIVPIMASVFGGKLSVGIVLPMLIFADMFAVKYYHRHANWRYVWMALPWALIGVIVATLFGNSIDDSTFKVFMAIIILSGIILMLVNDVLLKSKNIPDKWWFAAILGLAGGFTTMIGNAAGPVMALYLLSMRLPKNNFIGTAAWFFFLINILKVPFHIFSWETISIKTVMIDIIGFPAIVIGVVIGIKLVKLFPEKIFRYFIIISTILSALFLL
ncbi:MAG: sulfite exporter TauE/SafE family protein [Melioribacteraceae bacterium]|nr:sulfite exporter TauE/SafE family protein [Melioribacteraceae bacterium]